MDAAESLQLGLAATMIAGRLHGNVAIDTWPDGRIAIEVLQLATGRAGYFVGDTPAEAIRLAERQTASWPPCPCSAHDDADE